MPRYRVTPSDDPQQDPVVTAIAHIGLAPDGNYKAETWDAVLGEYVMETFAPIDDETALHLGLVEIV